MANYYAMGRTNHFAVKDPEAFQAEIEPLMNDGTIFREERDGVDGFILLFPDGLPTYYEEVNEESEEYGESYELDWIEIIATHLADGEVCVIQEIGFEKLRYLTGYATAFNNEGETKNINIYSIYKEAEALGNRITIAEY